VVRLERNRGYGGACNAGVRAACGRVLAFLNDDVEVRPGWARALVAALDADPEVVLAGGLTLRLGDTGTVDTARIRVAASLAGTDIGAGRRVAEVPVPARDLGALSGVALAAERGWFERSGGFDEDLFIYYEDLDLCLRA